MATTSTKLEKKQPTHTLRVAQREINHENITVDFVNLSLVFLMSLNFISCVCVDNNKLDEMTQKIFAFTSPAQAAEVEWLIWFAQYFTFSISSGF